MVDDVLVRGVADAITPYRDLLQTFARGDLSADDFETAYLASYLNDPRTEMSFDVFCVVDRFFSDVDAYVGDPHLRDPSEGDLGPDELRELARDLLRRAGYEA